MPDNGQTVRVSFQRTGGSVNANRLKIELCHDNERKDGGLPKDTLRRFKEAGGAWVECVRTANTYELILSPKQSRFCGGGVDLRESDNGDETHIVRRSLQCDKGSHSIITGLRDFLGDDCPQDMFPLMSFEVRMGENHHVHLSLSRDRLQSMPAIVEARSQQADSVSKKLGKFENNTPEKQLYRERVWPLLLPEGSYVPGLKVLTLSGCYKNEAELLHEKMGVKARDIVLVDNDVRGPIAIKNATKYPGLMLFGGKLSNVMDADSHKDVLHPGSVIAANIDMCGTIHQCHVAQIRLFLKSGALHNFCRLAVTYLRGRETTQLAGMRELGLGRHEILGAIMVQIADEAGYEAGLVDSGEYVNEAMPYGWSVFELRRFWGYDNKPTSDDTDAIDRIVNQRVREKLTQLIESEDE